MDEEVDITARRHGGNEFSAEAHRHATKSTRQAQRDKIVNLLTIEPGLICEEIAKKLGMRIQSASARLSELKQGGDKSIVVVSGTGITSSGSPAGRNWLRSQLQGQQELFPVAPPAKPVRRASMEPEQRQRKK